MVVILPAEKEDRMSAWIPREIEVVNLFECFSERVAEYRYAPPWRFSNDGHWAEQGNMLAAACLYRFLERDMNLTPLSEDRLGEELYRYYSAFPGWMPPDEWTTPTSVSRRESDAIRSKYLAYELAYEYENTEPPSASDASLVARSTFDLYLGEDRLIYFKKPCTEDETEPKFFLHLIPTTVESLPGPRRPHGFDNLDFAFDHHGWRRQETCRAMIWLPRYGIAAIRTGQYVPGAGRIWQEEFRVRR